MEIQRKRLYALYILRYGMLSREENMPIYEYRCRKCERFFEKIQSVKEQRELVQCPYCGAEKAERLLSKFSSSKGERASSSCGGGSSRFS